MKNLILIRHAKAEHFAPNSQGDFYRILSEKGIIEAKTMAHKLVGKVPKPDVVLCSSATRTLQTAEIFRENFFNDLKIQQEKMIYISSAEEIIDFIKLSGDTSETVWLFGHNPTISEIAFSLSPGFNEDMATCSVVWIKFDELSSTSFQLFSLVNSEVG